MKIIKPSAIILTPKDGIAALQFIESMARISHRSEDMQTNESWKKFLTSVVIQRGDWSVVEHSNSTVVFRVDRGVTHELVRHRLFSFTQESTRFVNYQKKGGELEFIKPVLLPETGQWHWEQAMISSEREYFELLKAGVRPQEARSVLPNALAATISVTGNLRNWRWFLLARTTQETHPDFRAVTVPLLVQFRDLIPILFDDIEPNARQVNNFQKPH
jgi:thymidylate synthase (FAD)